MVRVVEGKRIGGERGRAAAIVRLKRGVREGKSVVRGCGVGAKIILEGCVNENRQKINRAMAYLGKGY